MKVLLNIIELDFKVDFIEIIRLSQQFNFDIRGMVNWFNEF